MLVFSIRHRCVTCWCAWRWGWGFVPSTRRISPQAALAGHGMEAQHPDDFVSHLHDLAPAAVCAAVRGQREALKNPPRSVRELLDTFLSLGLAGTVARLESMQELL